MNITEFSFANEFRKWYLEKTSFGALNLLVGMSGVGKTQIVEAIKAVTRAGIRPVTEIVNGCSWTLEVDSEGTHYSWSAEVSLVKKGPGFSSDEEEGDLNIPIFIHEFVIDGNNRVLVKRQDEVFDFAGARLPKLKNTESAINLLRDEELIGPLHRALHRFIFSEASETHAYYVIDPAAVKRQMARFETLQALREAEQMPVVVKAYILQQKFPDEYQRIKDEYCDIFPAVTDVTVAPLDELDPAASGEEPGIFRERLMVGVREEGVDEWITGSRLSTGMFRVLIHLWELALAPPGTVIVIDEFENSLGVNCLPELTDRLQQRSGDLQFIITSHHPYIINNIPSSFWRIVTRRGSIVTVLNADSIPGLKDVSAQDKFIRLLNVPEYEGGIIERGWMNLYFLVEGRRTEKKVYRAWIKIPFPRLSEAQSIDEVRSDHYFILVGMGYPSYKQRIIAALDDITRHGAIDHFFICVDAEDTGLQNKITEVSEILSTGRPFARTHVIVHDCCMETWFLGNDRMLPRNPQGSGLRSMKGFYDVRTQDPEKMGCPNTYTSTAQFHFEYLRLMFQEHGLSYTKRNPGSVTEKQYFDALLRRATKTGHLGSFQRLVTTWRALGGSI